MALIEAPSYARPTRLAALPGPRLRLDNHLSIVFTLPMPFDMALMAFCSHFLGGALHAQAVAPVLYDVFPSQKQNTAQNEEGRQEKRLIMSIYYTSPYLVRTVSVRLFFQELSRILSTNGERSKSFSESLMIHDSDFAPALVLRVLIFMVVGWRVPTDDSRVPENRSLQVYT